MARATLVPLSFYGAAGDDGFRCLDAAGWTRWMVRGNGYMGWGPGGAVADTFLMRLGTGTLYTPGLLSVGNNLDVAGAVLIGSDCTLSRAASKQLLSDSSLIAPASTTNGASFRAPHGAAPTNPIDGDVWTTTAGIYVRINGATVGPLGSAAADSYADSIGDGTALTYPVTHSLGTRDVIVQVYDNATYADISCDVVRTSTTVVTLNFLVAPTTNQFRVLVKKAA